MLTDGYCPVASQGDRIVFTFQKMIKPFFWPPGLFVFLVMGLGLGLLFRRRIRSALACFLLAASMWLAATAPVADLLLRPLESRYSLPARFGGDVIIMLGSAIYAGAPDMDGVGTPSPEACERLLATVRLYRRTKLPIILSGGRVHSHQAMMGPVYRRFLVALGIPPEHILLEDKSRNTFENVRYSRDLCRKLGYRRPLVVTHAVHMPRAMFCFRRLQVPAIPVPCGFRTWSGKRYRWPDALPRSFSGVATALHEYLGLWAYRWQYPPTDPP